MSRYEGLAGQPDNIVRGGRWVDQNRRGSEVCNFLHCKDGNVYGHVETIKDETDRQIKIEAFGTSPDAESIDGVDVVWVATHGEGGRKVVGWYRNAIVYRERQKFEKPPSPQHAKDKIATYRVYAKSEDATRVLFEERLDPALCLGRGKGWIGQVNWWFPERQPDPAIKKFVRDLRKYIDTYDGHDKIAPKRHSKGKWGGGSDPDRKAEVENAATEAVKTYYKEHDVKHVEADNLGWDLEATPKKGGDTLCLEVKGLFGADLKVGLTPNEYRALVKHKGGEKPHYRLCVVTSALSEQPSLKIFHYDGASGKWIEDITGKSVALNIALLEAAIVSLI
jgi:hypothetical protein